MEYLLMLFVAGLIGGLIFELGNKINRREDEKKKKRENYD